MTGFKMDASFDFSSEDVVKSVCEISPLGTFERRCLTPRCSRNLPQAKYRQRSWLLETGASEISSIFAFWRVRMVSLAFIEIRPSASFHKPEAARGSPHFGGPSLLFCLWRACQLLKTLFAMS